MTDTGPRASFLSSFFVLRQLQTFQAKLPRLREQGGCRPARWLRICALLVCAGVAAATAHGQGRLTFSPTAANFGNVNLGSTTAIHVTITNTGSTSLPITQESLHANEYTVSGITLPMSIAAGASVVMTVKFTPTQAGAVSGYIVIGYGSTDALVNYDLSGTGVAATGSGTFAATPNNVAFGNLPVGTSSSQSVQLKNGGTQSVTISSATQSGTGFAMSGLTTPFTLAPGGTSNLTLKFAPAATGTDSGTLTLKNSAGVTALTLGMSGTGIASTRTLSASTTGLNFGTETVGSSERLAVTLTNTGNSSVSISGVSATGTGIAVAGGLSGATIAPGQTATLAVTFAPASAAQITGSATITSTATNSPTTIALRGTGVSATNAVALNWNASSSSGIVGYNVYRASPSTTYTKLVSSPVTALSYTDGTVVAGTTYTYVVTSVNSSGAESVYSTPSTAAVP